MLDIRKMPKNEASMIMNKALRLSTLTNTSISFIEEWNDWSLVMNMSDGSRLFGHGRGNINDGVTDYLYLGYIPPRGGNVRFDLKLLVDNASEDDKAIINKFNALLVSHGGSGKTFVRQFENLDIYNDSNGAYEPEYLTAQLSVKRNALQKLGLFLMRLGN